MSQSKLNQSGEVRIGHSLSEGEKQHVSRRRETVLQCLKRQGIDCSADSVPNIALLGSGGGERAMLGLLGSLVQLEKCDLLDSILYLSGVSGSTWCMASLYKEPDWSTNLDAAQDKIIKRLDGPAVSWSDVWRKLKKYYNEKDDFSLTDVWAALIVTTVIKEIDENNISRQKNYSKDPYPIYTVIDQQCKQKRDVWLEVGPHEAGYSLTGAFVISDSFGSQFEEGNLINKQPEMDMLYLQGLCGSALADREELKKWLWEKIQELFRYSRISSKTKMHTHSFSHSHTHTQTELLEVDQEVLLTLVKLNICVLNKEDPTDLITEMNKQLKGKLDKQGGKMFITAEEIRHEPSHEILKQYTMNICENFEDWFEDSETKNYSETLSSTQEVETESTGYFKRVEDLKIILKIIELLCTWTWGTTYNFLHKMKVGDVNPSVLSMEKRYYEDAGLLINSPYFSMLRKERDIDLIISLDFSTGNPMETVVNTAEMCRDLKIPFAEVKDPGPISKPHDFYLFEGKNEGPSVIHIPLFNKVNCDDHIKEWEHRYCTFQLPYKPKMISDLIAKAGENVINNKEKLLTQIRMVIEKKNAKTQ